MISHTSIPSSSTHKLALCDHNHQEAWETTLSFEHKRKKKVLTLYHTPWQSQQDNSVEAMKIETSYGERSSQLSRMRRTSRWQWKKDTPTLSHSPLFFFLCFVNFPSLIGYFKTLLITITVSRQFPGKFYFILLLFFFQVPRIFRPQWENKSGIP